MAWGVSSTAAGLPNDDAALGRSLTDLLQCLVRIPSRAGVDDCGVIFACIREWLAGKGVASEVLTGAGGPLALLAPVVDVRARPVLLLNATADTAGFGEITSWRHTPLSGTIEDGWLYGRGSADSKAGIAVFCHLLAAHAGCDGGGGLGCVFDADEHSGGFAGVRAALARHASLPEAVLIGYPGMDRIMAGARGVWRATVTVHGSAAHSGASQDRGNNAVAWAAALTTALAALHDEWRACVTVDSPLAPKLTVTGIRGGGEFSLVPDRCEIDIDIRVTPRLPAAAAEARVRAVLAAAGADADLAVRVTWPAYRLPPASPLVRALADAAQHVLGTRPPAAIAGPSNVGNLLAGLGVPATCGFGVVYRNVHAADECVELASLIPVHHIYDLAVQRLLGPAGTRA
jgi:succinyl-diaminopimelate desuccinylase